MDYMFPIGPRETGLEARASPSWEFTRLLWTRLQNLT